MPSNLSDNTSVVVQDTTISCSGQGGDNDKTGGHPRVFIKLDAQTKSGDCPYCGQNFKLDPGANIHDAH